MRTEGDGISLQAFEGGSEVWEFDPLSFVTDRFMVEDKAG